MCVTVECFRQFVIAPILLLCVCFESAIAQGAPDDLYSVRQLCIELTGPWDEVRLHPVWDVVWTDEQPWNGDPEFGDTVIAEPKYDDIDQDGNIDAFVGLFDGNIVYWFLMRGRSPSEWLRPQFLGRMAYVDWHDEDQPRNAVSAPRQVNWPASHHVAGRTFVCVATGRSKYGIDDGSSMYELRNNDLALVLSDESSRLAFGAHLRRWTLLATDMADQFLIYTHEGWQPLGYLYDARHRRMSTAGPLKEDERIALWRNQPEPVPPAKPVHRLHPERLAVELQGAPQSVLLAEFWEVVGEDANKLGFATPKDFAGVDIPPEAWSTSLRIECYPAYHDIDQNGLPDVFLALHQGFSVQWLALLQTSPSEWSYIGLIEGPSIEHQGGQLSNYPYAPDIQRVAGRTLVVASAGSYGDFGSTHKKVVYLVEWGKLIPLLNVPLREFDDHSEGNELVIREEGDTVLMMTVGVGADRKPTGKRVSAWRLLPGSQSAEPAP